jgi:hypothetical protein
MRIKKNLPGIILVIVFVLLTVYFLVLFYLDQREVSGFTNKIIAKSGNAYSLSDANFNQVVSIRDSVVFEIDQNILRLGKRKIWGHRVSQIIKKRAGHCGEVTRLLVNVFRRLNIPARRVTFFGRGMMHAVIEARIGGKWLILDTANGPKGFREFATANPASISSHFLKSSSLMINTCVASEELQHFNIFSYSYFYNLNPIFLRLFKLQVILLQPLPVWVYYLLENPPLLAALASFFFLVMIAIYLLVKIIKAKKI